MAPPFLICLEADLCPHEVSTTQGVVHHFIGVGGGASRVNRWWLLIQKILNAAKKLEAVRHVESRIQIKVVLRLNSLV